ncbi:MAG TPA: alpha/beta hydrolase, partial [SAR86 cluster bacterium]|nr:alpha/beta hydrolase [SAR86 cluster bacterium]
QITAIMKSGDRSEQVRSIKVSTLVQHGVDDTLLPLDHGEHTAELISNSKLKIYENMGHNLPPEVLPLVIEDMVNFFNVN